MDLNAAFDEYQGTVDADRDQVIVARVRRDIFKNALDAESDIVQGFGSGSLARSTQLKPVHDVDLIVVFDGELHPDWGNPGTSSEDALDHVAPTPVRHRPPLRVLEPDLTRHNDIDPWGCHMRQFSLPLP